MVGQYKYRKFHALYMDIFAVVLAFILPIVFVSLQEAPEVSKSSQEFKVSYVSLDDLRKQMGDEKNPTIFAFASDNGYSLSVPYIIENTDEFSNAFVLPKGKSVDGLADIENLRNDKEAFFAEDFLKPKKTRFVRDHVVLYSANDKVVESSNKVIVDWIFFDGIKDIEVPNLEKEIGKLTDEKGHVDMLVIFDKMGFVDDVIVLLDDSSITDVKELSKSFYKLRLKSPTEENSRTCRIRMTWRNNH